MGQPILHVGVRTASRGEGEWVIARIDTGTANSTRRFRPIILTIDATRAGQRGSHPSGAARTVREPFLSLSPLRHHQVRRLTGRSDAARQSAVDRRYPQVVTR